jgi:putative ABC transport system permease protein
VISNNPLSHKNDTLFRLQLDNWRPGEEFSWLSTGVPPVLSYPDAKAIYQADQADQTLIMVRSGISIEQSDSDAALTVRTSYLTTNSFFSFFDVMFIYGGPWSNQADQNGDQVVVISETMNHRFFDGADSLGKPVILDGEVFTVVGVVADTWGIRPTIYNLEGNPFADSPHIYVPFFNLERRPYRIWGSTIGWKSEAIDSYEDFLASEVLWVQAWVSLVDEEQYQSFSQFIRNYISDQQQIGRYQRPLKFMLSTPAQLLDIYEVVSRETKLLVGLGLAFLLVCLVNAVVLLLAKFLRKAPEAGLRRALGARRSAIFVQHLTEATVIGLVGGALGLALSWFGLAGVRALYSSYEAIAVMNSFTVMAALLLALARSLISGLLPAWQIANAQPSRYLKTQ